MPGYDLVEGLGLGLAAAIAGRVRSKGGDGHAGAQAISGPSR
jgi:hypothetical protein